MSNTSDGKFQTTQFSIKDLTLITEFGNYDISSMYSEINLYDNMFMPCMSGSILIRDSIDLLNSLRFDGNELISVQIGKQAEEELDGGYNLYNFRKIYRIYKVSNVTNTNQTTKIYILHFVSAEFLLSQQQKLNKHYGGTYDEIVKTIATENLKINPDYSYIPSNYGNYSKQKSGIVALTPTKKYVDFIAPNVTPLQAIDLICKRAVSDKNISDYVFFEVQFGYYFIPISKCMEYSPQVEGTIKIFPKNTFLSDSLENLYYARNLKVISQSNVSEATKKGIYAGKFVGFDTLTRTISNKNFTIDDTKALMAKDKGDKSAKIDSLNAFGKYPQEMEDSRVVTYPYMQSRKFSSWVLDNDKTVADYADNPEEYVYQRSSFIGQLLQKRVMLTMPGNFGFYSGTTVEVDIPKFSAKDAAFEDDGLDQSLSGKYLILGARHIIRPNMHETVIEISTDSVNMVK